LCLAASKDLLAFGLKKLEKLGLARVEPDMEVKDFGVSKDVEYLCFGVLVSSVSFFDCSFVFIVSLGFIIYY
jgi:hypothetical protein